MTEPGPLRLRSLPADDVSAGGQDSCPRDIHARDAETMVTQLYRDNGPFILGYVTSLLGDRHLAEDVVQETMLRAWHHCAGLRADKGSVRGWLVTVAHNIVMDKFRMRRARPVEVAADSAAEALAEDHAEAVVTALHVRRALARLSPAHRAVLEQVYLNDCTARQAAARLGIPEGTVFSRVYYALRILRQELVVSPPEDVYRAA